MSLKVQSFANFITTPLNIHNFTLTIPGLDDYILTCSSTTFPGQQLRTVTMHFQGESILYPTLPENSGSWDVTVPESDNGIMRRKFEALKSKIYDQRSGKLIVSNWYDIIVQSRDLADKHVFHVILHNCWIAGRDQVSLSNSDPTQNWNWSYRFYYNWLEDKDDNNSGSKAPVGDPGISLR